MGRRGGRVVSSDSTVVGAAAGAAIASPTSSLPSTVNSLSVSAAVATASAGSSSLAVTSQLSLNAKDESGVPGSLVGSSAIVRDAPTPPALDVFSRFQSKRGDFDEDWILMQEDAAARDAKPPIAAHVAAKLRRHQAQLGANRAAAAADRARQTKDRVAPSSAGAKTVRTVVSNDLDAVATERLQSAPRRRRPETYDSAEDGSNGAGDDNDEYVPEDRAASQYKRPKRAKQTPAKDQGSADVVLSDGSSSTSASVGHPAPTEMASASDGTASVEVPPDTLSGGEMQGGAESKHEGLSGDYLNFKSTSATQRGAVGTEALQATVYLRPYASRSERHTAAGASGSPHSRDQWRQTASTSQQTDGCRVMVVPLWSIRRMKQHGGYCRASPLIALHQEITDLVDYLRPTEAEVTMRRYIEKELGKLVDRLWPGSSVLVYGSMYTHLLLPLSDLDVTLLDVPVPAEEALTALAKEIADSGLCENAYPQVILKTKVPLIKFVHKDSLIDVDISVGAVDGKRNSECIVQYLNTYPEALPLILVVKYFIMQRGMHEPYHGGLGSYAATLLVVAFLRQHPIYTTQPEQRPMTGLGRLLVDFFRMCGQYWNYRRVAVCLEGVGVSDGERSATAANTNDSGDFRVRADCGGSGGCFMQSPVSPSSTRGPVGPAQAWVEDPVDRSNNAASSLRLFHSLSSMFSYAYHALAVDFADATADVSPAPSSSPSSPSSTDISRRPTLLSRIFHLDAEMVYRRQAVAATYERLRAEMPAFMKEVRRFRREADASMLQRNTDSAVYSWRARRLLRREGEPFLFPQQRNVTTLEERLALSRLRESLSPPSAELKGGAVKRQRECEPVESRRDVRKGRRERSVSSSRGTSRSPSHSSDSESNASSVRIDVTRRTERARKLRQ
ncbi:hypothetical protein JKF63_06437 [Porcisia hertigi]|uniref:Poly(A) RNA polymerase mitochondrial-like central palm domain-containing protein n=1 Tax=Porcisia hertigi TaxID=2761500 RepID=A0A836LK14_9TRYP|nr:hypothetical protein JKF63_06437 [Porcisia hertigi]